MEACLIAGACVQQTLHVNKARLIDVPDARLRVMEYPTPAPPKDLTIEETAAYVHPTTILSQNE